MKAKKKLLIIGAGFAGFWSAISAIRQIRDIEKEDQLEITVINRDKYLTVRPRLYETSLKGLRVDLEKYFTPLSIELIIGKVEVINPLEKEVNVFTDNGLRIKNYDYLILASGSTLKALNIPGIEQSFNVDTYINAKKLEQHLVTLAESGFSKEGATTFLVVGSGLTGLEMVTTIEEKVQMLNSEFSGDQKKFKVVLIEKNKEIADYYSSEAQSYILETLEKKNVEIVSDTYIISIENDTVLLNDGTTIKSGTVIFCNGMVASSLTNFFEGKRDEQGRLHVDNNLKLAEYSIVIVSGDVANLSINSDGKSSIMACQCSMDLGKWAGHNAVNDLFSNPLKPYINNNYGTCLDLGQEDGLLTSGFERKLLMKGCQAKQIKTMITTQGIYPPETLEETLALSFPKILAAEVF